MLYPKPISLLTICGRAKGVERPGCSPPRLLLTSLAGFGFRQEVLHYSGLTVCSLGGKNYELFLAIVYKACDFAAKVLAVHNHIYKAVL